MSFEQRPCQPAKTTRIILYHTENIVFYWLDKGIRADSLNYITVNLTYLIYNIVLFYLFHYRNEIVVDLLKRRRGCLPWREKKTMEFRGVTDRRMTVCIEHLDVIRVKAG